MNQYGFTEILPIFFMEKNNFEHVLLSIYILQDFEIAKEDFKLYTAEKEDDTPMVLTCLFADT